MFPLSPLFVRNENTEEKHMKPNQSRRGFLAVVIAGACLLPSVSNAATIVVGTGPDTSYYVLQSPNLGVRTYEVRYTYNASLMQDEFFLISQVLAGDASLTAVLDNSFGTVNNPNYLLNSITYNSVTELGVATPPYTPYWAQWVSGGQAGYPTASPITSGSWTFGSGMSAPYRLIAPGSWDARYFSDGSSPPSVAPIPETSSALLTLLGPLVIFRRRRN